MVNTGAALELDYLHGRTAHYPLTQYEKQNLSRLIAALVLIQDLSGIPIRIRTGYSPGIYSVPNGTHFSNCEAVDIQDVDRKLAGWLLKHVDLLEDANIYMQQPRSTPEWVHIRIRPGGSGKRIFS